MARARKEFRELTVSEATNYGRKTAPMLRIQGLWLQAGLQYWRSGSGQV